MSNLSLDPFTVFTNSINLLLKAQNNLKPVQIGSIFNTNPMTSDLNYWAAKWINSQDILTFYTSLSSANRITFLRYIINTYG